MTSGSCTEITNPFPGLRPFLEAEEHLFFGREHQVDTMVDKLAELRFLAVVGTSGSGKSSLVNCGLRPALHKGLMASAGTTWRMAQFRPGNHPLAAMAAALAEDGVLFRDFPERGLPLVEIIDTTLRMSKRGLIDIYEQALLAKDVNLLVVVDQFEELFRYRQLADGPQAGGSPADGHGFSEEATAFVKLLLEMQEQKDWPIFVVLTMRSDFLGDCTKFPGLAEVINAGLYLVPRLTPEERRDAIVNPIRVQGADIEPVLVTRLVNDVGDNPDQLSILQHALNRTWANWQQEGCTGPLALRNYEAIGAMASALDAHAEEAYAELATPGQEPSRQQRICERLFQALTDRATDGRGVRRPTTLNTLCALAEASAEEVKEVIEVFRQHSRSFLMPPAGETLQAEKVIDISHESLMRVWDRLKGWVKQEAEAAQTFRRLAESCSLHARGEASMLRDPELTIYQKWQQKRQPNAAWAERYAAGFGAAMEFLQRSIAERDAEQADRERRQEEEARRELEEANRARVAAEDRQRLFKRGLVGMGAFALLAVAGGGFAWWQLQEARAAAARAFAATAKAQLSNDPFDSVLNGLAAMGRLAGDPGASIELTDTLAKAVTRNWQIGSISTGQGSVRSLIKLQNGDLISGGADGTLRRWRSGKPLGAAIAAGQGQVNSLIELKGGELISGGEDGSLQRWRAGKPLGAAFATGQGEVLTLIELKNGDLISGGADGSLRRWRAGKPLGVAIATGQRQIYSLIQLKNGDLISAGDDGSLRRWRDGKAIGAAMPAGQGRVLSLIELKNGDLISGGSDGSLRRWRSGKPLGGAIATGHGEVNGLIELKNGDLISAGDDGSLRRWRAGKVVGAAIATGQSAVWTLIELKNGDLISGGFDGSLRRWRDGKAVGAAIPTGQGEVTRLMKLKNGDLISSGNDGSLRRWHDGKAVGAAIPTGQGEVRSLIELENGDLISGGNDGSLRRWRDGKAVGAAMPAGQGAVLSLIELKNGDLISGGFDGSLRRWRDGKMVGEAIASTSKISGIGIRISLDNTSQALSINSILPGSSASQAGLKPKDRIIAIDGKSTKGMSIVTTASLIRGKSGTNVRLTMRRKGEHLVVTVNRAPIPGKGGVTTLIKLRNGDVISGGGDGSLRRWRDGKSVGEAIATGQGTVRTLVELKNGDLISGGSDGSLRRWRDGKPEGPSLFTGQGRLWSMIELNNGDLISAGEDGSLQRWHDGKPVGEAVQGKVRSLVELKNGELISSGKDGSLKVFSPKVLKVVIKAACQELQEHPALLDPQTAAEKAARKTCRSRGYLKKGWSVAGG